MSAQDETAEATATGGQPGGEPILVREDAGGVCTLTLNRPAQYNALSEAMLVALQGALDAIAEDASVRVVVLAARGKAFCAGHDLKEMRALRCDRGRLAPSPPPDLPHNCGCGRGD